VEVWVMRDADRKKWVHQAWLKTAKKIRVCWALEFSPV